MSAPTTEPVRFENYPPEPDMLAPADVALPTASTPAPSEEWFPWWGYPAILLAAAIVCAVAIVAWGFSVPSSTQTDTSAWPQQADRHGCYDNEVRDAADMCVDRSAYNSADASVRADFKQGEKVVTSWASRAGFDSNTSKVREKYLCTAKYDQYGTFYAANHIGTEMPADIVLSIWKMVSQETQEQVLVAKVHLPYVSESSVAKEVCSIVPSWAKK